MVIDSASEVRDVESLARACSGSLLQIGHETAFFDYLRPLNMGWWSKQLITKHEIDKERCLQCGTCTDTCPVKAINYETYTVDRGSCLGCIGCLNNCPAQAVVMEYLGKEVTSFKTLCRQENIVITEPAELKEKA